VCSFVVLLFSIGELFKDFADEPIEHRHVVLVRADREQNLTPVFPLIVLWVEDMPTGRMKMWGT
jgi:hypothetical protein